MRAARAAFTAALLLSLLSAPAKADWPAEGRLVLCAYQSLNGVGYVRLVEMPSGNLIVVAKGVGGSGAGWSAVEVTREGDLAPDWTTKGVDLGSTSTLGSKLAGFTPDDSSGFWLAHGQESHHVLPDGSLESLWTSFNAYAWVDAAPAIGSSDAYFSDSWNRLQRMTRAGIPAPGWPANGLPVLPAPVFISYSAILADGTGGVVYVGLGADGLERATRVDADGSLHAGWPSGGLALGPVNILYAGADWPLRALVRSGADHFIAIWPEYAAGSDVVKRVLLQRFGLDGSLDPAWPVGGLQAAASDSISSVTMVADGEGGAYVLWERSQRPRATHVRADGTFVGSLDDTGVPLLPADAPYAPLPTWKTGHYLVADRGPGGGLVLVGGEPRPDPPVAMRVRWFLPDLSPDPAVPDTGVLVVDPGVHYATGFQRAALADGTGGIYLAWEGFYYDARCAMGHVSMTRVLYPTYVSVSPVSAPGALSLGGAMPNPVRASLVLQFSLPDDRPARLELFDVSGRRVRAAEARGAGPHVQRFDDLADLAPGLYLARLSQGGASRTTRFVRVN